MFQSKSTKNKKNNWKRPPLTVVPFCPLLIVRQAVVVIAQEILIRVINDLPLLLPDELLLLEVNLENSLDGDERESAEQRPVQIVVNIVEEDASDERGNRGK